MSLVCFALFAMTASATTVSKPAAADLEEQKTNASANLLKLQKATRQLLEIVGPVTIDGSPAHLDAPLGADAFLVLGPGARVALTLGPGMNIEIRDRAQVRLGRSPRRQFAVQIITGEVYSSISEGLDYEVNTANAIVLAAGGTFIVQAHNPTKTTLTVCAGQVHLTSADAQFDAAVPSGRVTQIKSVGSKQVVSSITAEPSGCQALRSSATDGKSGHGAPLSE